MSDVLCRWPAAAEFGSRVPKPGFTDADSRLVFSRVQ